jgi:hypothetical protein
MRRMSRAPALPLLAALSALLAGAWDLTGIVRTLFDSRYASFGTFNIREAGTCSSDS